MSELELINRAYADPEVRGLSRSSTRGGDENRHPSAAAAEEARRTTTGGNGEVGVTLQQSALAFNDLSSSAAGKSRALSKGLWERAFLTAYNSASDEERMRNADGRGTRQRRGACLTCSTNCRCFHLLAGSVPAHLFMDMGDLLELSKGLSKIDAKIFEGLWFKLRTSKPPFYFLD